MLLEPLLDLLYIPEHETLCHSNDFSVVAYRINVHSQLLHISSVWVTNIPDLLRNSLKHLHVVPVTTHLIHFFTLISHLHLLFSHQFQPAHCALDPHCFFPLFVFEEQSK